MIPDFPSSVVPVAKPSHRSGSQRLLAAASLWSLLAGTVVGSVGCRLTATGPALPVAARPAGFVLASTQGPLDSAAAVAQGPLVLIFYRGHW